MTNPDTRLCYAAANVQSVDSNHKLEDTFSGAAGVR
jgi:hypothetical protein